MLSLLLVVTNLLDIDRQNSSIDKQHNQTNVNNNSLLTTVLMNDCCNPKETMSGENNFLETFKSGSKRFATLVADTGAKTMLKVR